MTPVADPTLKFEREIVGLGRRRRAVAPADGSLSIDVPIDVETAEPPHSGLVIGCDEVGRGALAGPVAVGLCVIDVRVTKSVPKGLRDSKMLAEPRREELAPIARSWSLAHAVGYASALEIDRIGISACLGLAGARALDELAAAGVDVSSATIILDGQWDWLTPAVSRPLTIRTRIKADRDCASVAAASVISKVARDRLMIEHDGTFPHYGWVRNKGYASEEHRDAILSHGASELHRHTWLSKMMAAPLEEPAVALDGLDAVDGLERLGATADDSAA
ncbi:ribonuclease HII [Herbiconiux ginsengi]|uniref:Ribonuclease n=1 Tax=Herbiconiux ginsengi TaxID=381665 RepID=A0A1H3RRG9_9MICO|nr:ribonuclease HII [Herbiconiux ginsengi]SDZ28374.1 RNase HII [Herbiconiux ginsengi]